jgi:uncharacterized membrane protein YfcA
LLLDLGLGFVIGLSLGLLGGGGSILTVPALVYVGGQSPQAAVTTSLAIVGINSALGAYFHRTQGALNWRVALLFGGAGMLAAYFASGWSSRLSPQTLMTAFAALMLVVGGMMLLPRREPPGTAQAKPSLATILATGGGVGLLTGLLGVGGGFLIVPALVIVVGLPMVEAVSTSLIIIATNSLAGFIGHWSQGSFDMALAAVFVAAGLAGTLVGARLAPRLPAERLRQAFGVFVIGLAIFLLIDNWT